MGKKFSKEELLQEKETIAAMSKEERKASKKRIKMYKKYKNRHIRHTIWAVLACLLIGIIMIAAPMVSSIRELMGITFDSDTPEGIAARENGKVVAERISDEGIVLLKNTEDILPLEGAKLNVFGISAYNIRYGGGGSGGADQSSAVDLFTGLNNAGIEYNQDLHAYYSSRKDTSGKKDSAGIIQVVASMIGGKETDEPAFDYLTEEAMTQAEAYSDYALVVIGSDGVEAADLTLEELKLTQNKRDLIEYVASNYANVIVVINAGNSIELKFLEEYPSIKATLWIGTPGPYGCNSLGNVLAGKVTPSGRLVDTYAYDAGSNPASVNLGDYKYENIKDRSFINYNEGIYVGYRFYETFYQEDEAGYKKAVQFPFGYGLSYTDFAWETTAFETDKENIKVTVKVTNTGNREGKDVVQLYFSAPYTVDGMEKSAIELAGYAKTELLQPSQSQDVTISFPVRDMSSYDMEKEQAYILEKGDYRIKIAKNVHDIVDEKAFEVAEQIQYKTDDATDTEIVNQFEYGNGGLTYLSRDNWEGTYPNISELNYKAPQDVVDAYYAKPEKDMGESPITGADNGIMLADLKGAAYEDETWQSFIEQFTVEEMKQMVLNGAYKTMPVERLGVSQSVLLDGPAGINSFFSKITAASYPTEVVISSTWNDNLSYQWGEAVGMEADAYGVQGWYAPGMNIHRTPQGGRNFEYFSEDPLLSGKMSAAVVKGAQSNDILVFMKHFALNEQEVNARSGIFVWANEQAIREIYLRPFEITVKEGDVTGVMSSFIHIGYKWCGGNPALLEHVLRDEWGFEGVVSTDAVLGKFMDLNLAIRYGNDLMLDPMPSSNKKYFDKLYKKDPVGITKGLQERVHNIAYSLVNYTKLY